MRGFWRPWQSPLYTRSSHDYQRRNGHIWTGFLETRSCYLTISLVKTPGGDISKFHLFCLSWLQNFIFYWYLQLSDSSVNFLVSGDLSLWEKYATRKLLRKVGDTIEDCVWRFINDVNMELFHPIWSWKDGISFRGLIQPLAWCVALPYRGILDFTLVDGIFFSLFATLILAIFSSHLFKISLSKWFTFVPKVLRNWKIHIILMVQVSMGSPFPYLPAGNTWDALLCPDVLSISRSGWPIAVCGVESTLIWTPNREQVWRV